MRKSLKITTLFILLAILSIAPCWAQQNLVPNPSFEDTVQCPTSLSQLNFAKYWFNPTLHSPDYHHSCADTSTSFPASVPFNFFGYQYAASGTAYAGIGIAGYSGSREYIEIKLSDTLQANKNYCIEFSVSLADSANYATDDVGIYLSNDTVSSTSFYSLPYVPQLTNTEGNYITDKNNWMLISGDYVAQGGEQYITIGNFKDSTTTDKISVVGGDSTNNNYRGAYYYVDDVRVNLCDTTNSLRGGFDKHDISIYPNPSPSNFVIKINTNITKDFTLMIFNTEGQLIDKKKVDTRHNTQQIEFNLMDQPSGIYFFKIVTPTKILNRKVLIE